ncbi:MAG: hypothetical protein M1556_06445 [Candidatus Thermoplasmatota archaeon]|nr:hypothetical protein [Candidatus Thermoplasmatota archaeon]
MCDTVCSLKGNNSDPRTSMFGKNSDRDPNEIQVVEFYPRMVRNGKVRTTYIEVEYEGKTNAVVLSRPRWMWGAEMGVNERGVVAGNEAIFAPPKNRDKRLLGMDLLRLGLEKGADASSVANTIIEYLKTYGQGGSNDQSKEEYYNNLFLISDLKEAFELTVIGKEYLLKKTGSYHSVSNRISESDKDGNEVVKVSPQFSYRQDYLYTKLGRGAERFRFTSQALEDKSRNVQLQDIFRVMRHHDGSWSHPRMGTNRDVCMHAGPLSRRFQTVNSVVVETTERGIVIWSTFSSNPCISLYKPVLFSGTGLIGLSYNSDYWLKSERIHRNYLAGRSISIPDSGNELEEAQAQVIKIAREAIDECLFGNLTPPEIDKGIFEKISDIDDRFLSSLSSKIDRNNNTQSNGLYGSWWRKKEKSLAEMD